MSKFLRIDANAYQYDVDILPEVPPALNRKVFKYFENIESEGILGGIKPVYDGIQHFCKFIKLIFLNFLIFIMRIMLLFLFIISLKFFFRKDNF